MSPLPSFLPSLPSHTTLSHLNVAAVRADDVIEVEVGEVSDARLGDQDGVPAAPAVLVHAAGEGIRASGADAVLEGGSQSVYMKR